MLNISTIYLVKYNEKNNLIQFNSAAAAYPDKMQP